MAATKLFPQIISEKAKNSFWSKVAVPDNNELCWNWTGWVKEKKALHEYGVICIKRTNFTTHRFSYYLNFGIDPKEMCVLHHCDNPRCVNPKHLFLGTPNDNNQDKVTKGRQTKLPAWNKGVELPLQYGELNHQSKLTKNKVLSIRKQYSIGTISSIKLAAKYKVSKRLILNIIHRTAWKHI